jgi:resuscitation-promoting factor RpfA
VNTEKSPEAFRTISEVADWLGTPTHVLRFWESRFREIKPVKRAGGRRYYRPADMELLGGIKKLLHEDGMTIRGVQKMLREQGVRRVADLSPPLTPDGQSPTRAEPEAPRSADPRQGTSPVEPAPLERPGPPSPMDAAPTTPPSAAASAEGAEESLAGRSGTDHERTPQQPGQHLQAPADSAPPARAREAGMVEDAPGGLDSSAEIVPFVLDTPLRSDGSETPDLFDTPEPDRTGGKPEAPARPGNPALQLPAIPPDPDDGAPLSPLARPPLRGFRKPPGKPDERLLQLFEELSSLRDQMDRR